MTTPTQADHVKAAAEEIIARYISWPNPIAFENITIIIARHFPEPAPTADAGAKALQELTGDQLRCEQQEIREAHAALSQLNAPTNGAEGAGKRQSFSLAQRIAHLPAANVIAKARAVVNELEIAKYYISDCPLMDKVEILKIALDHLDAAEKETKP